jgi:uncharacterized protein (DUF58 family)
MTPRRPLFVLFVLASLPFVLAPALELLGQVSVRTAVRIGSVGVALDLLVLALAVIDAWLSPSLSRVETVREAPDVLSVGASNAVKVWLTNRNRVPLIVEYHDSIPQPATAAGLPFKLELLPDRPRYRVYHVTPHQRGRYEYGDLFLTCRSRWGFWSLFEQRPQRHPVRIYPDIQAVHGIELLARKNRVAETGLKLSRLRGRGSEFDRLREYRRNDEFRHIDWKATARHQEIVSREYVIERNQNILIVLDAGRSMCNSAGGLSHLDRALNAAIVLSYVALRQGDNVGLLAFSNRVERWVRPVRGAGGIQTIIRHTYDLEPRYEASDYQLMVDELRRRFRKRSLVILLTHALDEVHLRSISQSLRELRSPYLAVGAFLRSVGLHEKLNQQPAGELEAFQVAAAADVVAAQNLQIADLQHAGLFVLDVLPEQLSGSVLSQYLDIKARHLL